MCQKKTEKKEQRAKTSEKKTEQPIFRCFVVPCACGALSKRQRGGGEGQKDVAGVGARLLEKCTELNRSASRRVASEFTN